MKLDSASLPEDAIPRRWITAGSSLLWGTNGTYSTVAYERLPLVPPLDSPFEWLSYVPDRNYDYTLGSNDNKLTSLPAIKEGLKKLGIRLPDDFLTFIESPEIQRRIPSCTGCFLELSHATTPLPGFPGSRVIRFMNDSQNCVLWYLLFQPKKPFRVLACPHFIERDIFDAMEYEVSENQPLVYEDVLTGACICAESFGEFLCRFGLENMIWFATHDDDELSTLEQEYLDQAK